MTSKRIASARGQRPEAPKFALNELLGTLNVGHSDD